MYRPDDLINVRRAAGEIVDDGFPVFDLTQTTAGPDKVRMFAGLDLGQSQDYTALAIIQQQGNSKDGFQFNCVHLQRWPLRTSYPAIVVDVIRLMNAPELMPDGNYPVLAVDATGVGAPVVDLFRRERMNAALKAVQITGGADESYENFTYRVPKRNLVSQMQVALQQDRLNVAKSLPEASNFIREAQTFQVKINDNAHDSYGAWREGTHDDLVLAVAIALWATSFSGSGIYV